MLSATWSVWCWSSDDSDSDYRPCDLSGGLNLIDVY